MNLCKNRISFQLFSIIYNIRWIKNEFNNPKVIITENGWSDEGELNDLGRIDYMRDHLKAVLEAREWGCDVIGYTHWSVIDNFEWASGYT